jgi:2C-methyl-D-erythritol 2,4-cyclodiphosphate synthase
MRSVQSVHSVELLHLKDKQKDHDYTVQKLDTEIKAEFKRMSEKIDEMPQKIVDFIKSTRII